MTPQEERPLTVLEALQRATAFLKSNGLDEARLDAEILLAYVRGTDRLHLYLAHDEPLDGAAIDRYRTLIMERSRRKPTAYLMGRREFRSLNFLVDERVLVPRPETEHVVDAALAFLKGRGAAPAVLDVGVGSGAILLSIAHEIRKGTFVGVDISAGALAVCRANADRLVPEVAVELRAGDLFEPLKSAGGTAIRFDLILSNPPYIRKDEMAALDAGVRVHEPSIALDAGADALSFHRRLIRGGMEFLTPDGAIILELPGSGGEELARFAESIEAGSRVRVLPDFARHERVFVLERVSAASRERESGTTPDPAVL
jgi:release factor glutamine methyltransferase